MGFSTTCTPFSISKATGDLWVERCPVHVSNEKIVSAGVISISHLGTRLVIEGYTVSATEK